MKSLLRGIGMRYGFVLAGVSVLLATYTIRGGGAWYSLIWPASSFAISALAYFVDAPSVFGKRADGTLTPWRVVVLFPYFACLWGLWHLQRVVGREAAMNTIASGVIIGRRLLSHELPGEVDVVVDLTAEFAEPRALRSVAHYVAFPILDAMSPAPQALASVARRTAALGQRVYIHCAQGHGRTALFTALYLVATGHAANIEEAIERVRSARPLAKLNRGQLATLHRAAELLYRG